ARRVDVGQRRAAHPVAGDDVLVERIRGADRLGDGRQVRPCAVELLGVGGKPGRATAVGRPAIAELVRWIGVLGEQAHPLLPTISWPNATPPSLGGTARCVIT